MGKPSKITTRQVEVAAPDAPAKPLRKGKREAAEVIEKEVSKKKQKKNAATEEVIVKEVGKKKQKKNDVAEEVIVKEVTENRHQKNKAEDKTEQKRSRGKIVKKKTEDKTEQEMVVKNLETNDDSSNSESGKEVIMEEASEKKQKKRKAVCKTEKKQAVGKTEKKKLVKKEGSPDDSSESEDEAEQKSVAVESVATRKKPIPSAKVAHKASNSEDSDSSDKSGDKVIKGKVAATAKNGLVSVAKKKEESSEDSESEDEDTEDLDENVTAKGTAAAAAAANKNEKGTSDKKDASVSDSKKESSSEQDIPETKKGPASNTKDGPVKNEDDPSGDSDSTDSSSDVAASDKVSTAAPKIASLTANKKKDESTDPDDQAPNKTVASKSPATDAKQGKKDNEDSSEDESSEESEEEKPQKKKAKVQLVGTPNAVESSVKGGKEDCKGDEYGSEEASGDEPSKALAAKKSGTATTKSSSSGEEEGSSEKDDEKDKIPKKNVTDVEMVDVLPTKPNAESLSLSSEKETGASLTQSRTSGSKTLYIGNLSFSVEREDLENLFKDYGDIVSMRFGIRPDGAFKGFGHVEFATAEAAQKAFEEKNGQDLLGRPVKLDIAAERRAYTPQSSNDASLYQKGAGPHGRTVYVRGFDTSGDEHGIKEALRARFSSCGEITRVSLPRDEYGLKGFAYVDFAMNDAVTKALGLDKSEVNGYPLVVEEAKPRFRDSPSGGRFSGGWGGGSDSGGRFGGSRFGDRGGGRFGDRGHFGGRGGTGGYFGGRGRGRGTPS